MLQLQCYVINVTTPMLSCQLVTLHVPITLMYCWYSGTFRYTLYIWNYL